MFEIYLPISTAQKPLHYHYQSDDQFISQLLFLGSLFRALPYFDSVFLSPSNNKTLVSRLQLILKNPSSITCSKPNFNNFHTISISAEKDNQADLISAISFDQSIESAQTISITGNGKGKTTIGLGILLFNLLNEPEVSSFHFFKNKNYQNNISEFTFPTLINRNLIMHTQNTDFLLPGDSKQKFSQHQQSTQNFITQIKNNISRRTNPSINSGQAVCSPTFNLILLDEIIDALIADLINQSQLEEISTLARQNNTKLILTGRYTQSDQFNITHLFDSNIIVQKIKHPYDSGIMAIKGLDY